MRFSPALLLLISKPNRIVARDSPDPCQAEAQDSADARTTTLFPLEKTVDTIFEHAAVARPQLGHVEAAVVRHPDVGSVKGHASGPLPTPKVPTVGIPAATPRAAAEYALA